MRNGDDQTRLIIAIILLLASGPFVIPSVQWGTLDMLWLVAWAVVVGLVAYPLAFIWQRTTKNRRKEEGL